MFVICQFQCHPGTFRYTAKALCVLNQKAVHQTSWVFNYRKRSRESVIHYLWKNMFLFLADGETNERSRKITPLYKKAKFHLSLSYLTHLDTLNKPIPYLLYISSLKQMHQIILYSSLRKMACILIDQGHQTWVKPLSTLSVTRRI